MKEKDQHIYKSHNKTLLLYHFVFPAKYRKEVFDPKVDRTLKEVCLGISNRYEIHFVEIGNDLDHVHYVVKQKNKLTSFTFEDTFVFKFCLQLSDSFNNIELDKNINYSGLGYLGKWLQRTKVNIPKFLTFSDSFLLEELKSREIDEVVSFYTYCYIAFTEEYLRFIDKNKVTLFAVLKEKTNSIIVKEEGKELDIQYLIDPEKMDKLHECSVGRIDIFKSIFTIS